LISSSRLPSHLDSRIAWDNLRKSIRKNCCGEYTSAVSPRFDAVITFGFPLITFDSPCSTSLTPCFRSFLDYFVFVLSGRSWTRWYRRGYGGSINQERIHDCQQFNRAPSPASYLVCKLSKKGGIGPGTSFSNWASCLVGKMQRRGWDNQVGPSG